MSILLDWLKAVVIVIAIIVTIYSAWILAIITAIALFTYGVKNIIELSKE